MRVVALIVIAWLTLVIETAYGTRLQALGLRPVLLPVVIALTAVVCRNWQGIVLAGLIGLSGDLVTSGPAGAEMFCALVLALICQICTHRAETKRWYEFPLGRVVPLFLLLNTTYVIGFDLITARLSSSVLDVAATAQSAAVAACASTVLTAVVVGTIRYASRLIGVRQAFVAGR